MESDWVVVDRSGKIIKEGTKQECASYFMRHCGKVELTGTSDIAFCSRERYIEMMKSAGKCV